MNLSLSAPAAMRLLRSAGPALRRALRLSLLRALRVAALALLLGGAALPWRSAALHAQTIEVSAQAEVPVLADNLDQARTRAIREAEVQSLQRAIEGLVAPEWRTLYDRELRRRILSRLDRYLSSFRTTRSEPSADRTKYVAAVTAQVSRVPLAEDLRNLPVPVLTDPKRTVRILYEQDDPVMGSTPLRQDVLAALQPRLELLNFQVSGVTALSAQQAALLRETGDAKRRAELLSAQRAEAGLFVQFRLGAPGAPTPAGRESLIEATLYHGAQGGVLGSFDQRVEASPPGGRLRDFVTGSLVAPLVAQILPAGLQPFSAFAVSSAQLDLRVLGLDTVAAQEGFAAAFFRPSSPFARFGLARIEPGAIVYRGSYGANRAGAERELIGKTFGDYVVRRVNWLGTTLELEVRGTAQAVHRELDLFPQAGRPGTVQDALQAFLSRGNMPDLADPLYSEHEDNGWLDRANALAFNAPIYGLIDARADSDFYVGEALAEGETIEVVWARLERTNLVPVLRLYDGLGQPVRTVVPRFYTRFTYKIPEGQHAFYVEVADRFGFIQGESGGYLKFPYLLTVRRQSPR